jgi:hypothetical protein
MSYRAGDHYLICDECGFKIRRSESRHRWDKAIVCGKCWEPRHPQDFVRGRRDRQSVPDARPEPPDHFLEVGDVTPESL